MTIDGWDLIDFKIIWFIFGTLRSSREEDVRNKEYRVL